MTTDDPFIHPTAIVDAEVSIGRGTRIWHFCHVSSRAVLGERCVLGQNVFVAPGVRIGNGVKIQNNVSLYVGVEVEDDVFLGPSCVLTNVMNPRSHIERKSEFRATRLRRGCSIGANATIVCGHEVGSYAFVGAGAVVTADVEPYALVYGTPARRHGWVCQCGTRLHGHGRVACGECGARYEVGAHCVPVEVES